MLITDEKIEVSGPSLLTIRNHKNEPNRTKRTIAKFTETNSAISARLSAAT